MPSAPLSSPAFCYRSMLHPPLLNSIRPAYKATCLDEILARSCSILPSVRGFVLGALFSSKVAYSWILIPGNSCGVYISSVNHISIICNNGALELASSCLLCSLTDGTTTHFPSLFPSYNRSVPICNYSNINISCTEMS